MTDDSGGVYEPVWRPAPAALIGVSTRLTFERESNVHYLFYVRNMFFCLWMVLACFDP